MAAVLLKPGKDNWNITLVVLTFAYLVKNVHIYIDKGYHDKRGQERIGRTK